MSEGWAERIAAELAVIEKTRMPFGKYGPQHYPPEGLPIYDLPAEYLAWFAQKGWPRGRLGELLQKVYQMKVDGSDVVFDELRRRNGGRSVLRPPKRQHWDIDPK